MSFGSQKLQESQDISVAARLEAAKRRLHERYEQVETGEYYFASFAEDNSFLNLWSKVEFNLEFNMTFSRKLLVLHTTPSMFGKLLVPALRWCGGFNREHSIWVH